MARANVITAYRWCGVILAATILTHGCASRPSDDDPEAIAAYDELNDRLEPTNRVIFDVNDSIDESVVEPAARGYRTVVPDLGRQGIGNFLQNLRSPVNLANDILQGKGERAHDTLIRFLVNSTFGVGGLIDVASAEGMEGHDEDFGQTLAVWGVGEGPYFVIPLLGPSNARDATGLVVDTFFDPLTFVAPFVVSLSRRVVDGVDQREEVLEALEEIKGTSIDYYATIRSLYRQRRENEIRDGEPPPFPDISFDDEFEEEFVDELEKDVAPEEVDDIDVEESGDKDSVSSLD